MPQQNYILRLFLSPCDIFIAASLTSAPSVHFITASLLAHCADAKMQLLTDYQNTSLYFNPYFHSKEKEVISGKTPDTPHILSITLTGPPT